MSDFAMISQALPQVFTLYNMMLIFGGLILGMVIGCVPGLSVTLGIMLVSSIALLIQSLVLKQEKVVEFDWEKEKPAILLIVGMCVYIVLMLCIGYVLASLIVFPLVLFYVGERKPGPYIVVVVSAFAIFLLFKNVFNISLPALGLLGGII